MIRGIAVALVVLGVSGCAMHAPDISNRPNWARFGNTSHADDPSDFHRDPHHQYYDKARRRYYYYDADKKQFFWENGEPKN
jgi:hypothetical protein